MSEKLAACPFCGGSDVYATLAFEDRSQVVCGNCGADGPCFSKRGADGTGVWAWGDRAADPVLARLLEAAEGLLRDAHWGESVVTTWRTRAESLSAAVAEARARFPDRDPDLA